MVRPITAWLDSEGTLHMTEVDARKAQARIDLRSIITATIDDVYFSGMLASDIVDALMLRASLILEAADVASASRLKKA